jgi:dipeptidyl aminopeptidase/acylaminoacyl peptidase
LTGHLRRIAVLLLLLPAAAAPLLAQTVPETQPGQPAAIQTGHAPASSSAPAPIPAAQTAPATHPSTPSATPTQTAHTPAPTTTTALATAPPPIPIRTEIGHIDGASFRIDIPKNWNHGLVLYFHGYEPTPQTFDPKYPPTRILQEILNRGYAVARSGYAVGGWAVPQASSETDALRRYFRKKYGQPRETFLMGHSMGGLLTVMGLEQDPKDYAGGLAVCGVLAPADLVMQRAFANRVAFDAFFPGVLPDVE